ncbi:MAG: YHS domain-containing protein [Pyrinomonadaceae bacterium]
MDHKSHIDPVCGMRVEKTNAAGEYEHEGLMYYFDSEECMKLFYQHPDQYTHKSAADELGDSSQVSEPSEKELK